ncbi:hypothetical protein AAP_00370 [Ascosphaera apis ARSEF 7405]|uniref:DNA-directed RNA polymerase subunit n=1 Tax=Ascosphaera apis ARSEF 7405 TaxID=392613 RepID=A0A168DU30_9EURO|nr:hypothetical protein AAP_00370 [Ascosphaera apis ARSEF 7405]
MDSDSTPKAVSATPLEKKEKKRHHKDKDGSSSKKRKHESSSAGDAEHKKKKKEKAEQKRHESFLESEAATFSPKPKSKRSTGNATTTAPKKSGSSPYHLITSTLYLPLSPISISPSHALSSLLSEHLSPLLLTYYPPFHGVVLAYSNPSMSSTPPKSASSQSQNGGSSFKPLTLAKTAGEYGVMFILEGWVNVQSEGFLGAIVNNLFSVGIDRRRLPKDWKWVAPGDGTFSSASSVAGTEIESEYERDEEVDKDASTGPDCVGLTGNDNSVATLENAEDDSTGYFVTPSGRRVRGTIRFRVRDVDVIPGAERDKGFISIEGSMLSKDDEAKLLAEERRKAGGGKSNIDTSVGRRLGDTSVNQESAGAVPQDDAMDIDEPLHEEVNAVKVKKEKKEKKDKKDKKEKKSKKNSQ